MVEEHLDTWSLNRLLQMSGLSKSSWYAAQRKKGDADTYRHLRGPLLKIAEEHPEYGYRRTTVELKHRGYRVNHKVVERLHRLWYLVLARRVKPPAPHPVRQLVKRAGHQANLVSTLDTIAELQVLYTDFTAILYREGRAQAQLMPLLDHKSKLVLGHAVGPSADTDLALRAWEKADKTLQGLGQPPQEVIVHHDQDGVYLGYRWVRALVLNSGVRLSYSLNGARENVHMESFNSRFKNENRDLFWWQESLDDLRTVVHERIRYYNEVRRHSALHYLSPMDYLRKQGWFLQ